MNAFTHWFMSAPLLCALTWSALAEPSTDPMVWAERADKALRDLPVELQEGEDFANPRCDAAWEQARIWADLDQREKAAEMIGVMMGAGGQDWVTTSDLAYIYKRIGNDRLAQLAIESPEDGLMLAWAVCDVGRAQFFNGEREDGMKGMLWGAKQAPEEVKLLQGEEGSIYTAVDAAAVGTHAAGWLADSGYLSEAEQVLANVPAGPTKASAMVNLASWYRFAGEDLKATQLVKHATLMLERDAKNVEADAAALKKLDASDQAAAPDEDDEAMWAREDQRYPIEERQMERDDARAMLAAWSAAVGDEDSQTRYLAEMETDEYAVWAHALVSTSHALAGRHAEASKWWNTGLDLVEKGEKSEQYFGGVGLGYAATYSPEVLALAAKAIEDNPEVYWRAGMMQGIADGLREAKLREANLKPAE